MCRRDNYEPVNNVTGSDDDVADAVSKTANCYNYLLLNFVLFLLGQINPHESRRVFYE